MSAMHLRRYRAERLLRKDFAGLRAKVLAIVRGQLRAKGIALDPADLEACYAQAWHGLYATLLAGEQVENPSAWLVLVTFRRAIDEHRSATRAGVVDGEGIRAYPSDTGASSTDLASGYDDRARLRHVFEALRMRLSVREREAASLCYLQGLTRVQAAERMGLSEARMRKLMEGAGPGRPGVAGKLGKLLETIEAGDWCEQQSSLMRAYAFGILDPDGERHALAVAHCRECPACRAHVASLRGLASVLPVALLPSLAGADRVSHAGRAGAGGRGGAGVRAGGAEGREVAGVRAGGAEGREVAGVRAGGAGGREVAGVRAAGAGGRTAVATGTRSALGGGWGALPGSLTVKLAVTAVVLVAGGYAALGGHAHASQTARRANSAPGATAPAPAPLVSAPWSAPFGRPPRARARDAAHKQAPRSANRQRRLRAAAAPASLEAPAREFGPERPGAAPAQATAPPKSPAAGEFGFE